MHQPSGAQNQKTPAPAVKGRAAGLFFKRCQDIAAGLLLVLTLPLLVVLSCWIKIDSRGPVLFIQPRLGKNGKVFHCYKFRTMVSDAEKVLERLLEGKPALKEEWRRHYKLENDNRVTRAGRWLRKTSLDELPQLINVLRGEMSLVGPRPRPNWEIPAGRWFMPPAHMKPLPGPTPW